MNPFRATTLLLLLLAGACNSPPRPEAVEPPHLSSIAEPYAARPLAQRLDDAMLAAESAGGAVLASTDEDVLATAWRLEVGGHHRAAMESLTAATVRAPDDPAPRILQARFSVQSGEPEAALAALRAVPTTGEAADVARPWRGVALLALGDLDVAEPLLREEIAIGNEPRLAAMALARAFAALELHGEARAVIDAALIRSPADLELRLYAAELQRDVFLRVEAESALRAILLDRPESDEARCSLAELLYEEGRDSDCRSVLAAITVLPPPDLAARRERLLKDLAVAGQGKTRPIGPRALLAAVRGAPLPADRRAALHALLSNPQTQEAAFVAAIRHGDEQQRVMAVEMLPARGDDICGDLQRVADDPDASVRAAVARRLATAPQTEAMLELLSARLAAEEDPVVFRALHESLCSRLGARVDLPIGAESDPRVRDSTLQAWRKVWAEKSW